jgi:Flp pilus assembly protein TadB
MPPARCSHSRRGGAEDRWQNGSVALPVRREIVRCRRLARRPRERTLSVELISRLCVSFRTLTENSRSPRKGKAMSLTALLLLAAIFFLILYLIWLLPAPWRVRQIIQIVAVILGLVYLYQHQSLLHF